VEMQDLPAIVKAAKEKDVVVGIDNTWGAGYFLKPLQMGIGLSAHALTKYPCGHSDAMMGSISCATDALFAKIQVASRAYGNSVSPDDCYLVQRGLRTMPTRLHRHFESGLKIAQWLEQRPEVSRVMHPGLESHPGHALWKRDFTGACGLFSILVDAPDRDRLAAMIEGYDLFGIGAS
ncbi:MAG TPA: cystathionine beta-lyase, partial [Rhodospirillaceae bacterium]|nr:cystathionine beta-lyase [Rhodospirillaceae bacterium]